jgi:uncharacterized protein (DUF58 family)
VRLTALGAGTLAVAAATVVAGVLLGIPAAVAVGVFLVALVACGALIVIEVPNVHVARAAFPTEVQRGDPAEVRLRFRSTSARRARQFSIIETIDDERRVATVGPISPQGNDHLNYAVSTARRGLVVAGPVTVRRFDPFGLVTAERRFSSTCTISVRPRRYPLRMLPTGRHRDLDGPTSERSEGSATFHQLREYVPGDDLRRIHWRSSARVGKLQVKQLVDTTRPELVVILDNRASAIEPGDFEHAVDIAASVVQAALDEDYPTLLLFADETSDPDASGHTIAAVDRLTAVALGRSDSLADLAQAIVARGRSLVFVTGEVSEHDLVTLGKLTRGFSPAYLVSVVAERRSPVVPPRGMQVVACADGAEFAELWGAARR